MPKIDGFQRTDSFRFNRDESSSSFSLSSSSGYGSRLSLSTTSNNRYDLSKYFKEKLSRHKSLMSLVQSTSQTDTTNIYEQVWNLEEQIEKFRLSFDSQSTVSLSVDSPATIDHQLE